jgi:two-component system CheB/CheR fusion protein
MVGPPNNDAQGSAASPVSPAPDGAEQEEADLIDPPYPGHGSHHHPMVGLGGSAGSIKAIQAFFEAMPPDPGMVFVIILHLAPDYPSILSEMINRWTKMPVYQAHDGQKVEPDHVYVIPPGKYLTTIDGHLRLVDLDRELGRRTAVDLFFRSLADTHGPRAAAIVLSGADGDGTIGIKRIKERGGLTIVQDPNEAEHSSMPLAAVSTGMVDWILDCREMPRRIVDYFAQADRLRLPAEDVPVPAQAAVVAGDAAESAFREILLFLRSRTGRDFAYYKRATILRRISRRMQVNGLDDMPAYLEFLRLHQGEAAALLKDLLISVTNFFRDRDSFTALEARLPELFAYKDHGEPIRVWCPACASGEEAYSVAMMLLDYAQKTDLSPVIQVFGCDLDEDAIQIARAGIYPEAIIADVSEARLRRYFVREHQGFRIRREVRECVLFATHDLLKDAPFSRLDMVTCRNLLIYFNRDAQKRAFDIFHFALKDHGLLFLGTSESIDEDSRLFEVLDKKHRIYRRDSSPRVSMPVPVPPGTMLVRQIEQQVAMANAASAKRSLTLPAAVFSQSASVALKGTPSPVAGGDDAMSWSELHFKLIEMLAPPSVVVDRDHEVRHLSENAGRFLQMASGTPTTNLLRLIHPALRADLRAAFFRAAQNGEPAEAFALPIELDGRKEYVDLRVSSASELVPGYLLVTFDLRRAPPALEFQRPPTTPTEPLFQHLERELEQLRSHLRDTVEQYEASTEELKASNEELQAMNEELRSATEELETSREELQSINEELTTVNQESKNKVDELGHANSDLQNLMSATAIATVFLDRDMRVMRFTAPAAPIFNLIAGDIGRPLSDLHYRIDYPAIAADAEKVLQTLAPVEREVSEPQGPCYLARMLPYRTIDDRIGGVVLTFVDITERQRAASELHAHIEQLERFNQATIGRELRMVELKREINELSVRTGGTPRYSLEFEDDDV